MTKRAYVYVVLWLIKMTAVLFKSLLTLIFPKPSATDAASDIAPMPATHDKWPRPRPLMRDNFRQISEPGFGDPWNAYPWSMQWWRGKLYVGTNRAFGCIEYYSIHSALPRVIRYPPRFDQDVKCTESPYDLPLQAEIWCFTPETESWKRVYQSPNDVAVPQQPGTRVARDIGFRGMTVFTEPDGSDALYVAGVSARPLDPGLPPPRLLRSVDGATFQAIPNVAGSVLGDINAVGFRASATYKGRLYVTAGSLYGDGVVLEAENPSDGNDQFRQVSPARGMRVYEMITFNGCLYMGVWHPIKGYTVVKTDATGKPPYTFAMVVPYGAFRAQPWRSFGVLSMHVFADRLFVGTDLPAELLCIYPDDHWDLIMGQPRKTPNGPKYPLSGMGDGFDYALNISLQRMQEHAGWLYAGTLNVTRKQGLAPLLGRLGKLHTGFDLYATCDGVHFERITCTGFDDDANIGVRTFASTPVGLFLGAANEREGAKVYLGRQ